MSEFFHVVSEFTNAFEGLASNDTLVETECTKKLSHYTLYQVSLVPAVLIMISFGFTKKRRTLFLEILKGRPGLVYPMDMMTRDTSISYAAAFGATLFLVYIVVFEQKYAFEYHGPSALKSLIVIASMLIYGMVFFPVFACLAIGSAYGYAVGSMYVWLFTGLTLYQTFHCAHTLRLKDELLLVARSVPQFGCLFYLCCSLPGRCFITYRKGAGFFHSIQDKYHKQTIEQIKKSYVGLHVRKLFKKPEPNPPCPVGRMNMIKAKLTSLWHKAVYKSDEGFEYSSRFLSVMFMGVCLLYMLTLELSSLAYLIDVFANVLSNVKESTVIAAQNNENEDVELILLWIDFFEHFTRSAKVCYIVALFFTVLLNIVSILHMMSSYRRNLTKLHRGDYSHIPPREKRTNDNLLVGSIRYAGYQVAYIAWGFVIQFSIIFLFCLAITCIVVFLDVGFSDWLLDILKNYGPILASALIINFLQTLLARYAFLQNKGALLALENRRMLFCFTYFMYFYNVFLGLISCLLRIVKAIVLGALLLCRLDNSTLPERFQFFDPGFAAYVGYMHIENSHNHPVVLVLVRILLASRRTKTDSILLTIGENFCRAKDNSPEMIERLRNIRRRQAARFNWHVYYTLIHNPELRLYRKGYLQALRKAKERGITIPVSDCFINDPVQFMIQEGEKEESKCHKASRNTDKKRDTFVSYV